MSVHKLINKFIVKVLKFVTSNQIYPSFSSIETESTSICIQIHRQSQSLSIVTTQVHKILHSIPFKRQANEMTNLTSNQPTN